MYVTGVGNVAKKYEKRRGEYSECGLGFSVPNSLGQPLQHDVRYVCERLVPAPRSRHLYYAGYSLFIPIRYSDDRTLPFFLTNTVSVAVPTEIINDFLVN